ncbi:MYND finger [Verticillium dahliae]|nr:Tripeptidyl aminopeptidase [Verticillium dahliae VDG2]
MHVGPRLLLRHGTDRVPGPRKLDITCCDTEPSILARNIVLFSFIIDHGDDLDSSSLWNMYYHLYLDGSDMECLSSQSKKLVASSENLEAWKSGVYGSILPFSDEGTLDDIRAVWLKYAAASTEPDSAQRDAFQSHLKRSLADMALQFRSKENELPFVTTAMRSAAPILTAKQEDVVQEYKHFWKHGTIGFDAPSIPNPMIAASLSEQVALHYGTNPILGFHLATGYAPLAEASPLRPEYRHEKFKAVASAKAQFKAWLIACSALFKARHLVVRFASADVFAFCHTLQHQDSSAGWYRRQFDSRVLELNVEPGVPRVFDVIDTSNLADHVGTLNLLVSLIPLLAPQPWATLSTETLLKGSSSSDQEILDNLLCGHAPTVSLLLGVSPVEYWTNATAVSTLQEIMLGLSAFKTGPTQVHSRISWKHNGSLSGTHASIRVEIQPQELAAIVFQMYLKMFAHENPMAMLTLSGPGSSQYGPTSVFTHFHRGSLMALLKFLGKSTLVADIAEICMELDKMILADKTLVFSSQHAQERGSLFHVHNLFSPDWLRSAIRRSPSAGPFAAWSEIPEVVAVTLVIPRAEVSRLYTSSPEARLSAPTFMGSLRSSPTAASQWHNTFGDVHLNFGTVSTSGLATEDGFCVHVDQDENGWSSNAPLIASFYVPAGALQAEPKSALIGLEVQVSPQSQAIYYPVLGPEMLVFQARLDETKHVFVTKYLPGQKRYPVYCAGPANSDTASGTPGISGQSRFMAESDLSGKITSIVGRLSQLPQQAEQLLKDKTVVKLRQASPFTVEFVFVDTKVALPMTFPVPVDSRNGRTRVARKSGYVEAVVPFGEPLSLPALTDFIYPSLAAREVSQKRGVKSTSARLNFKESLFTIFMIASGLQGGQTGLFAIDHPDRGGIHMLLFVSAFRLDGAASSIVLDAAILPLTVSIITSGDVGDFLMTLRTLEICSITVDDDELVLWKRALPALAERGRSWSHKKSCEYVKSGKIPLSVEPGESVLCSCGVGRFPDSFVGVPYWEQGAKHATRIAISPTFAVSFVEDVFDFDRFRSLASNEDVPAKERCSNCRATEAKGTGGPLKKCSRCQTAKYCSAECQKKDWRVHRGECAPKLQ